MDENKKSGVSPEDNESTKGFPIVSEEEAADASSFEIKKRQKDGSWVPAAPVSVSSVSGKEDTEPVTETLEEPAADTEAPEETTEELTDEAPETAAEQADAAPEAPETEPPVTEELRDEPSEEPQASAEKPEEPQKKRSIGKRVAAIIAAAVVVVVVAFSAFTYTYSGIFPGVTVAGEYKLSGMTQEEAQDYIANDVQNSILEESISLTGTDVPSGEEKTYDIKLADVVDSVDSATSAQQAYQMGREGGYFQRVSTVLGCIFGGREISLNATLKDGAVQAQVDTIASDLAYDPTQPSWQVDKESAKLNIDTGKQGNGFDTDKVVTDISAQAQSVNLEAYTIETYAVDQDKPDASAIAEDVNTDPQNATVDKSDGTTVLDAVDGVKVEADAISSAIGDASEQTYSVDVELTPAEVTKADLEPVLFRDVIGSTTTYYSSGNAGRTTNVRLATKAINGTILNPGEEFSYNDTVGERTASKGYRSAIIFSNGEEVDGLGGGVCQVSSTVYMAVLRADLEVTERYNHQFQISYTPISQDAAVYWGSKDFKFVNNTPYPIKLVASAGGGSLTVQLYGTKTSDKTISFSSKSYVSGRYKHASLYKTVTENGQSTTTKVNDSSYLLQ